MKVVRLGEIQAPLVVQSAMQFRKYFGYDNQVILQSKSLDLKPFWRVNNFLVLLFLLCSTSTAFRLLEGSDNQNYGRLRFVQDITGIVIVVIWSLKLSGHIFQSLKKPGIFLLLTFALLSVGWSQQPLQAIRIWFGLLISILLGSYFAKTNERNSSYNLFLYLNLFGILSSMTLLLLHISTSTTPVYRVGIGYIEFPIGVYGWNSEFGFAAALVAIISLNNFLKTKLASQLFIFLLGCYATKISHSVASLVALILAILAVVTYEYLTRTAWVFCVIVGTLVTLYEVRNSPSLIEATTGIFGRSGNLTGRTGIWEIILSKGIGSQIFGVGLSGDANFAAKYGHAHNSFIQTYYLLGVIGTVLMASFVIKIFVKTVGSGNALNLGLFVFVLISAQANNFFITQFFSLTLLAFLYYSD